MRKFYALVFFTIFVNAFSQVSIDNNFGNQGKVITNVGPDGAIYDMAQQSDGKIVACGIRFDPAGSPGQRYFSLLSRYNTNGTLDTTFGTNGTINTNLGWVNFGTENSVAIQSDGKIILAGGTEQGSGNHVFAMTRYLDNGNLDTSFGTNGVVTTDFNDIGGNANGARAIQIDANDKIILAGGGSSTLAFDTNFAIMRYTSEGLLDSSFGTGGKAEVNIGFTSIGGSGTDRCTSFKILPDGKLIFVGRTTAEGTSTNQNLAMIRLNANGTLDSTFGFNGIVVRDYGVRDYDFSLAITSDDKLIVSGSSYTADYSNCKIIVAKFNADGSNDTTFGSNGLVLNNVNGTGLNDGLMSVTLQNDGKILACGFSSNGTVVEFLLLRMNANGSLDTTFSPTGFITTGFGHLHALAYTMLMQSDGKIVLGGETGDNSSFTEYALARYDLGTLSALSFDSAHFTIAPNPVASVLTIYGSRINLQSVSIFNQLGQLVLKSGNENTIDVSHLKTGTYFATVYTETTTETIKFIKD